MGATNSPVTSRLFVQEGAGQPLYYVGCVGVRGLVLDPRQQEFSRCVDESGVTTDVIPRYPNPQPFDVTFGANFRKWYSLFKNTKKACHPNFFIANALCEDETKIADSSYWDDAVWLYDVTPNSGYQVGNNTIMNKDPNQAVAREDQVSMTHTDGTFMGHMTYGAISTIAGVQAVHSLAVVDSGKCADFICRPCDAEGCLDVLVNVGTDFMYSVDGGDNFTLITGSGAGIAQAFNGNGFMTKATSILLSLDISAALAAWTTATTDVAFAGLCNIVQIDPQTLVVGGEDGAVWRSKNGGGNWVQIRAPSAGTPHFAAMGYNKTLNQIVAVLFNTTDISIAVSSDRGKNWTTIGTNPVPAETYGVNTDPQVLPAGPQTFVRINGNIYKITCSHSVTTYAALTLVGVTGNATGMGIMDEKNPNDILVTTHDTGVWNVWRSNDGLNTITPAELTFTISGGSTVYNPMAVCHGKYGDSMFMFFGPHMYYARDWDSFFSE